MKSTFWEDIRQSLYNTLDHALLEQGAYTNVTGGQTNVKGYDLSALYSVIDPSLNLPSGYVFQSAFHNWNYESGVVNQPSPIVASGVYIDGIFAPKSSGMSIDYLNGRVIFNKPLNPSARVQASFSYKEYSFVAPFSDVLDTLATNFTDNSKIYNQPFAATPDEIYLPAMYIEVQEGSEEGFQFGGTHQTMPIFTITLISNKRSQIEAIASVFASKSTTSFPIVPISQGPKLNSVNDLKAPYSFYDWVSLSSNFAYIKSVNYNRFYNFREDKLEPSLYGGTVTVEILAVR